MLVTNLAIGDDYIAEQNFLLESLLEHNPHIKTFFGFTSHLKHPISVRDSRDEISVPYHAQNFGSWNKITLLKPWWILAALTRAGKNEVVLWLDADARVRGNVESIEMSESIACPLLPPSEYLTGTLFVKNNDEGLESIKLWHAECAKFIYVGKTNRWAVHDGAFFNILAYRSRIQVQSLGEEWGSLPPMLVGPKDKPPLVYPTLDDAIIWHWQKSRGLTVGWNWPPPEELRKK